MRIFLSELLCSGAWDAPIDHALLGEGRAMLVALAQDLHEARCEVVTTWDARLGPCPIDATVFPVKSPNEEPHRFAAACAAADAAYIIAPEIDRQLTRRCRSAAELGCCPLNAAEKALDLCGDKWALHEWARHHTVRTIPTELLAAQQTPSFPLVVKPRDGAGATETFIVQNAAELQHRTAGLDRSRYIVQPFLEGEPASIAAVFDQNGTLRHVFPECRQTIEITTGGEINYCGGRVEVGASSGLEQAVRSLATQITGFRGYIGFDYLIPPDGPPILVEINPRLTTSYLGYRECCTTNLASEVCGIARDRVELSWRPGTVEYRCGGSVSAREPASCTNA